MSHLIIDLAKIGLIVVSAGIVVAACLDTYGMSYDPYADEFYTPSSEDDDII
jgi:hypothetical protein